jgi:hypothetical protein
MKNLKKKILMIKNNSYNFFKGFFGGVKWFTKEIVKMYSGQKSFFSKKRVESGLSFIIAQIGMLFFLFKRIDTMDMYDLGMWAGIEFLIAGYTVNQIQKEKKLHQEIDEHEENSDRQILNG